MFLQTGAKEGEFPLQFGGVVNRFLLFNFMYECGCFQVPCKGEEPFSEVLDMAQETCP